MTDTPAPYPILYGRARAHHSYCKCTKIFGVKRHTDNARRKKNKTQESSANGQCYWLFGTTVMNNQITRIFEGNEPRRHRSASR